MLTVAWIGLLIGLIIINILEIREWKRAKRFADMTIENWKRSSEELEEVWKKVKEEQNEDGGIHNKEGSGGDR